MVSAYRNEGGVVAAPKTSRCTKAKMNTKINLKLESLQDIADKAVASMLAERDRRIAKVLEEHALAKAEFDQLPWYSRWWWANPKDHPAHCDVFSYWDDAWYRARSFNEGIIKEGLDIVNDRGCPEATITIDLKVYNILKSWAQKKE